MKLEAVTWVDAADNTDVSLRDCETKGTKNFLVKRTTYGKVVREDKDGIITVRDQDEDGNCEIVAIPKPWVVKRVGTDD